MPRDARMSPSRKERRKQERRSSSLYLRFLDHGTGEVVGDLADISRSGFCLESTEPIPLNAEFTFDVEVPPEISGKRYIVVAARSRWSARDPLDSGLYDTGFEITQIDPEDTRAVDLI